MKFTEVLNEARHMHFRRYRPQYRRTSWDPKLRIKTQRCGNHITIYQLIDGSRYTTIFRPTREDLLASDWAVVFPESRK